MSVVHGFNHQPRTNFSTIGQCTAELLLFDTFALGSFSQLKLCGPNCTEFVKHKDIAQSPIISTFKVGLPVFYIVAPFGNFSDSNRTFVEKRSHTFHPVNINEKQLKCLSGFFVRNLWTRPLIYFDREGSATYGLVLSCSHLARRWAALECRSAWLVVDAQVKVCFRETHSPS